MDVREEGGVGSSVIVMPFGRKGLGVAIRSS